MKNRKIKKLLARVLVTGILAAALTGNSVIAYAAVSEESAQKITGLPEPLLIPMHGKKLMDSMSMTEARRSPELKKRALMSANIMEQ